MSSRRLPATPAPGPLEDYASAFDELFSKRNPREGFRRYLEGLLLPSERNKTLTGLANTEPVVGSVHPEAQKLQWFLSESNWDPAIINERRLALLQENLPTAAGNPSAVPRFTEARPKTLRLNVRSCGQHRCRRSRRSMASLPRSASTGKGSYRP